MKFVLAILLIAQLAYISLSAPNHESQHHASGGAEASQSHNKGGGHEEHGHKKVTEAKSKHDEEKANKGQTLKVIHKVEDEEGGGKVHSHNSEDSHSSSKKSSGGSSHGLKHQNGAKRKKLNYRKGFREKYHKDEENKHDRFYSNAHKTGEFSVFGAKHSKHSSNQASKKQGDNSKKSNSGNSHGKSSGKAGGHTRQEQSAHRGKSGSEGHHQHGNKWGKKSSSKGGKQYYFGAPPEK